MISEYFGDTSAIDCGVCDNCLKRKATPLSTEEFERISLSILNSLSDDPVSVNDLLEKIKFAPKEKAWQVIRFLQSERQIEMDKEGLVRTVLNR
jgi:ATP-dependent DNA helicase RecQ